MLEIELKYAAWPPDLEQRLAGLAARFVGRSEEHDAYWAAPHRDFQQTREALRIRHRPGGVPCITYKGPRQPGTAKTRREVEARLASADDAQHLAAILEALSFRPVATIRKTRATWQFNRDGFEFSLCLDQVDGVGQFVELEIIASEVERDEATRVLMDLGAELGLLDPEPRSYLRMFLEFNPSLAAARETSPGTTGGDSTLATGGGTTTAKDVGSASTASGASTITSSGGSPAAARGSSTTAAGGEVP